MMDQRVGIVAVIVAVVGLWWWRRHQRVGPVALLWVLVAVVAAPLIKTGGAAQAEPAPPHASQACAGGAPAGPVAGFAGPQLVNAATIVAVGQEMKVPPRGHLVALATAMQESRLQNLPDLPGRGDSAGLFQQRPSMGWGTYQQVTDARHAATIFYRRLLAVPGWDRLAVTVAAQAVQRSGLPNAYAKWEDEAVRVLAAVSVTCKTR